MKQKFTLIIFVFFAFNLQAQYRLDIGGSFGISNGYTILFNKTYANNNNTNSIIPSFCYQATIGNSFDFQKHNLNIDLAFINKNDNRTIDKKLLTYKYYYVIVPIYYGFKKNKFTFNLGTSHNFSFNFEKIPSEYYIKKYNMSLILGADYKINNRLNLRANILSDILPYNNYYVYTGGGRKIIGFYFIYNLMIGVSYSIFKIQK